MRSLAYHALSLRMARNRFTEAVPRKIAWLLPHSVVEWAAIRLMAHATTGKFGNSVPSETDIMTALERWGQDNASR